MKINIDCIFLNGHYKDIIPNTKFTFKNYKYDVSVNKLKDNTPELIYLYDYYGIDFTLVMSMDYIINSFIIRPFKQKKSFIIQSETVLELNSISLDSMINWLNFQKVNWKFSSINNKVVAIFLIKNRIEIIYSYETDEVGLSLIQSIPFAFDFYDKTK